MLELLSLPTTPTIVKTCELAGRKISYRVYENLQYCLQPLDPIQTMNIYVPEPYYQGAAIGPYTKTTAPIFMPNAVGGYLPGPVEEPGWNERLNTWNSLFLAIEHGYVVASVGLRGRTSGKQTVEFFEGSTTGIVSTETGNKVGRAPAFIVDLKAAIRYLRYNKGVLPGNTERIITSGTSAGGALSALAGATGNSEDFEPYLDEIGALKERDDIFAANCYCPIHNLENADAAYEWQFVNQLHFYRTKHLRTNSGTKRIPYNGRMTEDQQKMSKQLKRLFPAYVNRLELKDEQGRDLTLDEQGEGSFKQFVKQALCESASQELLTGQIREKLLNLMVVGSEIQQQDYLKIEKGRVVDLDWEAFVAKITRMKATPAFDALDLSSPENEEFGDELVAARHFTDFSLNNSVSPNSEKASEDIIKMINPTSYLKDCSVKVAPHWRVRHGAFDRDTSLAIPVILARLLANRGLDVDFALPWGLPHSGDYDLEELFEWIDQLC